MKKYIVSVFILLYNSGIIAQKELSLHFMRGVTQSAFTNPAIDTSSKKILLLPSVFYNMYTPDFTLKKLFGLNAKGIRDINEIAATILQNKNRFSIHFNSSTLGYAYSPLPSLRLTFSHAYSANLIGDIDGVLIKAFTNDYEKYIGKSIPFYGIANASIYHQITLGAAYQYRENLSIGVRLKLLKGIASVFTRSAKSLVTIVDYNYATTYNNDINLLTYSFDDLSNFKSVGGLLNQSFNLRNMGVGLDLGMTYKMKNWQFAASVIDAPSAIFWRKDGINYVGKGLRQFSGIGSSVNILQSKQNRSFNIKDTLKNILGLSNTVNPTHTEFFSVKTYLSASYTLNNKIKLGALLYNEYGKNIDANTDIMLNTTYKISNNFEAGGTWSMRNKRFDNFGLHGTGRYKLLQVYALTENILTAFYAPKFKSASARVGINVFL